MRGASLPRRSWSGIAGAAFLIAAGAIHLDLYLTGYRSIPTIGWLFLVQVISAFVLAAAILVSGYPLAAAAGAAFALGTLGGYLLSLKVGLFGFTEVRTTAGIVAAIIDVAAFAALAIAVASAYGLGRARPAADRGRVYHRARAAQRRPRHSQGRARRGRHPGAEGQADRRRDGADQRQGPHALLVRPGLAGQVGLLRVLRRLLAARPRPRLGRPGVTGQLGTITRTDGTTQAVYDGHPLYTYIGDSAPGQDAGNDLNLNGGLWRDVPAA